MQISGATSFAAALAAAVLVVGSAPAADGAAEVPSTPQPRADGLTLAQQPSLDIGVERDVAVIAHRGSSGVAPENTAAAVRTAIDQGADFVEIDVQPTRDGRLAVLHDCDLARTTDVEERFPDRAPYRTIDFTWEELRTLDAGSWFDERFAGERIPSLREVVDLVDGRAGLLAEVKSCGQSGVGEDLADELLAIPGYVDQALAHDRLVMQSFDENDLEEFHERLPDVPIGLLTSSRPSDAALVKLSDRVDLVNPSRTVVDRALLDRIHELGMTAVVWTVNDEAEMQELIELGADGIITNYPQFLTERPSLSTLLTGGRF